jgi:class 3 adenylate cyclase
MSATGSALAQTSIPVQSGGASRRLTLAPRDFGDHSEHQSLPMGTVTLLLADVEGSTRIWESQPREMAAALTAMDRVLAEVVPAYNGVCPVEQGEGDSFVVAFARASDAVMCALALQQAVPALLRLRIGVHTGEVQLRDQGKYMGPTINRAARLRDLGHGGQTLLSGTTRDLVAELLPVRTWLTDLGGYALRDLASPERVAQLSHHTLRNHFPPLRTCPAKPVQRRRLTLVDGVSAASRNSVHRKGFGALRLFDYLGRDPSY